VFITTQKIPTDQTAIREELARIKADKLARRMEREKGLQAQEEAAAAKGWFKWW
jgi:protein PET100